MHATTPLSRLPLLLLLPLLTIHATPPPSPQGGGEFSLDEFYSIKRTLRTRQQSKRHGSGAANNVGGGTGVEGKDGGVGGSSVGLAGAKRTAAAVEGLLKGELRFYGREHYERFEDGRWEHVGRPDELLFWMFFRGPLKVNGTFIESGAGDGVKDSNTLFFEERLGWRGLLIEGSRENFLALAGGGRRGGSVKVFAAVCARRGGGRVKFVGDGNAAGMVEDLSRRHVESWGGFFNSLEVYEVRCERMDVLVERAGLWKGGNAVVDLWSIDIEGGEWRALRSFDWERVRVRVVVIEMGRTCFGGAGGGNRCEGLLREQGFCRVARRAVNEFWTSDERFKAAYCRP